MHFMRVDLPAPLSPTTPTTSPAAKSRLTPRKTSTLPKFFRASTRRNRYSAMSGHSEPGTQPVEPYRENQHDADRHLLIKGLDPQEIEAVLHDTHDQCADQGADDRAAAAE